MKTLVVALSGGEMLLRRDWFDDRLAGARSGFRSPSIHSRRPDRRSDSRPDAGARSDGARQSFIPLDESAFDAFTRRPGTFRKVVAGIDRLLRAAGVRAIAQGAAHDAATLTRGAGAIRGLGERRAVASCRALAVRSPRRRTATRSPLALSRPARGPRERGPAVRCSAVTTDRRSTRRLRSAPPRPVTPASTRAERLLPATSSPAPT